MVSRSPMRILCLTPWFPDSPGKREGNYVFDSVMSLREMGLELKVLVVRAWKPWERRGIHLDEFASDLELKLYHYPSIPRNYLQSYNQRLFSFWMHQKVFDYARAHGVQMIHAHTESMAEVAACVAKELGIGCAVTIHGINTAHRYLGTASQRTYFRKALNKCDRVILVGEPLRPYFADLCGHDDHFRVVHNGFRLEGSPRDRKILLSRITRLISVSNLHEGKGVDLTIRALSRLNAGGWNDWHYTIVGDGDRREELKRMVVENQLEGMISFVGAVEHTEVADYLNEADIFVLPSYREAFGIAYLEAMACGLLVIGVEGQGAAEFIRHNVNGLLVKSQDVDDLVEKITYTVLDIDKARRMAQAGRMTAVTECNWSEHAKALTAVFKEIVEG